MTFANLSQTLTNEGETFNIQVSKNIHHQGETSFCWAFAISSMLRNSLLKYGKCNMNRVKASHFHKRLRNEIVMGPIPKAKYFDFKNSTSQRKIEIITAQGHIVTSAIERVNMQHKVYFANLFLASPSDNGRSTRTSTATGCTRCH